MSEGREVRSSTRRFWGNIVSVIAILFAAGGIVSAFLRAGANISAGVVGIVLGILGYFLGSRRLGTVAVILCIAALFFGLAASQGLIPGIPQYDRSLPAIEPRAD
ncbi:MAG: hypothetical protein AB1425_12375 [Actinomycetota bacterium]